MISKVLPLLLLLATSQAVPVFGPSYVHEAPVSYSVAAPISKQIISAPVYAKQVVAAPAYTQVVHSAPILHSAPLLQKTIAYPQQPIYHSAPQVYHSAPQVYHSAPQVYHSAPQIVHAAPQVYHTPVIQKQVVAKIHAPEPIDPNPKYSFAYGVTDPHTGDSKTAEEHLENGVVHGSYSLVEPDGHVRKVTYTADHINGFNAVVERTGGAHVAKVVAAPVHKVIAAPAYPVVSHYH